MMSNKLTYKKVFVDSQYRLPQSKSSSDFVVGLNVGLQKCRCLLLGKQQK
jgi:hypothetical protein